jgi:predicted small secreted protein
MRKISSILTLVSMVALTACQTVEGAGKDLQSAGTAISREAQQAAR